MSRRVLIFGSLVFLVFFPWVSRTFGQVAGNTITVCSSGCDYISIQPALDAAQPGDTVLVSPGTYTGGLSMTKAVTLASHFSITGDANFVDTTVLDGGTPIVDVTLTGSGAKVVGFTFTGGTNGVVANAENTEVVDNRFINVGGDKISWERVGGVIRRNYIERGGDDCIDLDGPTGGYIEDNTCIYTSDDGIEARLFNYAGPMRHIYIRGNKITGAREDAIQLIDYDQPSDYTIHIERNVLANSAFAGIGIMDGGNTIEDYSGASIPERVQVVNNTIVGNNYGITGGDNLAAVNNIVSSNTTMGMKNVDGGSAVSYNLFYGNGTDYTSSNVDLPTTVFQDPLLDLNYMPGAGSPAVDAGTASFIFNGETIVNLGPFEYAGAAPDLGRYEYGLVTTPTPTPTGTTPMPTLTPTPTPGGPTTIITKQIVTGSDDAEENVSSGSMSLTSSDLEFTTDGTKTQAVGMRFTDLSIPQGAIITNAVIEFTADEQQTDITDLSFYAQAADDPATFTASSGDINSRLKTLGSTVWRDIEVWTVSQKYKTPDLSLVVQEVVNRPGWMSGSAMVFIVTGTGHRTAEAFEGVPTLAPKLVVTYTTDPNAPTPTPTLTPTPSPTPTSTPIPTPTPTPASGSTTVTIQVATSGDDAEENASKGSISLTSTDLEFSADGTKIQTVGMRFASVSVPTGATITDASIQFVAKETQPDATDLTFYGQATDNAPAFTTAKFDVSGRAKTLSSVTWNTVPVWTVGVNYQTPNLAPVIGEIINRPGWVSGNALAIVVTGTGHRTAYSYNGGASKAAKLVVTYQ